MFYKCFKSRLCFFKNPEFLQFYFIFAKIYISHIYLLIIKSFTLKNKNFCIWKNLKSSLFLYKSWFFTISFYICQNIHIQNIFIKYEIFYFKYEIFNFKYEIFNFKYEIFYIKYEIFYIEYEIFYIKNLKLFGKMCSYVFFVY